MNPTILGLQAQGFLIRFLHSSCSTWRATRPALFRHQMLDVLGVRKPRLDTPKLELLHLGICGVPLCLNWLLAAECRQRPASLGPFCLAAIIQESPQIYGCP